MYILLVFGGDAPLWAQQTKQLYIANDDHTDYMWTANEAAYDSAFVKMLDYYLFQIDSTKGEPDDLQARFNCDGSYWLKVYEKYRSPKQFNKLVEAIRSGHISSPLNSLVSTYGAQPTEAVIRGMYDAGKLERKLGLRFPLAVSMENQTLPLGLSSIWAGCGAKYSWKGVCACASRIPDDEFRHRKHQLYHYTGLDSSSVLMKWYNLGPNNTYLGGYAEARGGQKPKVPAESIGTMLNYLDRMCGDETGGYPYNIAGAFGYGWDELATYVSPDFITAAKKKTNSQIKVRISNEIDFFEEVERKYKNLPREAVSYGNDWDTYCVSMNETTAKVRRATEKLRSAEALSSIIAAKKDSKFGNQLTAARELAWESYGMYWEHDWTADGPVSRKERADWQIKIQEQISSYVDTLFNQSVQTMGNYIKKGANPRFFVFNSLNWVRNDVADFAYNGSKAIKVIDLSTGKETPFQFITKANKSFIRLQADSIPSVGYKVFELQKGSARSFPAAATVKGDYVSNTYYRLKLSPSGAITEIFDIAAARQLVKLTDGKYVNDLGTPDINDGEKLVVESQGPVSLTLKAVSRNPLMHTVRVTLYAKSPRIEVENELQENFADIKTWAFSFDLKGQTTRHEELGAVITAKNEHNGGHYASQSARYDWLTFNHFVNLSEDNYGVTLSNLDCSFFRLGNSRPDSLFEDASQINALAGGQTDVYQQPLPKKDSVVLGIRGQNGETKFNYHFAIGSHSSAFDPTASMKFSLEHQNPLLTGEATGSTQASSLTSYSLLSVTDPSVILWSVKPAEEGISKGLITRFWNTKNRSVNTLINYNGGISKAWRVSHLETDEEELSLVNKGLMLPIRANQILTYRILP